MAAVKLEAVHPDRGTEAEAELSRKFLYYMALMREVEERIERRLYRQGKVLGGVYVGRGQEAMRAGRHAGVELARGAVRLKGVWLLAGDGAAVSEEAALEFSGEAESEVLLFDLA